MLTQFPGKGQCGGGIPTLVQGESPQEETTGCPAPSTPGKQHPPHPHSEVCRRWKLGRHQLCLWPGELATWSSVTVTVMGRAGPAQGQ